VRRMAGCWQWLCLPRPQPPLLQLPPKVNGREIRRGISRRAVEPIGFTQRGLQGGSTARGSCRLVVVALDYKGSGCELSCTVDGDHVQALAKQCGVEDVTVAYNEECTPAKFKEIFRSVGARCQPNDTLLFYFSGHGTCVKDLDGDEDDGMDEAFVLVNDNGDINLDTALITDDEFVQIMMNAVPPQTTIITICDCCHSGTIMDFNKTVWTNRKAVSMTGSRDTQSAGEAESGGICTHSILLAIESLQRRGLQSYPIKKLFQETVVQEEAVFSSEQDITLNRSAGCMKMGIPWPLVPKTLYTAPYRRPGDISNKTSTTTAAPVDAPVPQIRILPKSDLPVVTLRSSSPLRSLSSSLQPLWSPTAGTGAKTFMASQPSSKALLNHGSASVGLPAGIRQSTSGPCLPASGQHSSCSSPRYSTLLHTPSMTPQKQWVSQQQRQQQQKQQQKQQVVLWRATH